MKKLLFALAALASLSSVPAYAATAAQAFIVSACGSLPSGLTYAASTYGIITMDTTGKLCDSATGGSGGTSATYGAAFPSTGTPSGGTDGTNFQPLVVDTTTHYLQVDVKAGGAGGGAVYGPTAVGTAAANPPVLTGGTADGTGTGAVGVWKIVSGVGYANTAQINGVTILTGAGAAGTGSARVAVGQDTTTIAGSAPGTAGTASANVVTVQGVASMTPILATLQASATTAIGKVDPNTIATWGLATLGGATAPTNALAVAAEYLSSPPTYTTGQTGALQVTAAGSLHTTVDNSNANGATTASASSPVVQPTDQVSGKPISSLVKGTTASMTGTTSTQLIAATASKVTYVMNIDCVNSSATATLVTLQDGSAGTALGTVAAAASGGGHAVHATFPETWTTSGNGLYVANVTTGAAVICTASGFAQ